MNGAAVDYPRDVCLHRLIEAQVRRTPDRIAVVAEEGSLSYAELNARANRLARHLRALGVGPDVLVAICVERSLAMMVGLLGVLKAGGAYVPMDPSYPLERLGMMLEDAQAPVLLVHGPTERLLDAGAAKRVSLDDPTVAPGLASGRDAEAERDLEGGATAENLAYVIFTSGSTGRPKGAMNEHRAIVNRLLWTQDEYRLGADDRVLQKTPFSFDVSVWELFWPLLVGAELVMARPGGHKDSDYLVEVIRSRAITTLHFVPSMLRVFLPNRDVSRCTSVKRVLCSGEALTPALVTEFYAKLDRAELHNLYGPTEAAVDVTYWPCPRGVALRTVPIGRPVANTQIHILGDDLRPVPDGEPGELFIGGVQVGRGYWRRPELTRERFVPDPFSSDPAARLYKTGDLARVMVEAPDHAIEYLGRIDFQVKLRGLRIELGEIEAALVADPAVAQAVVVLRQDREDDARLVAYLIAKGAERPTVAVRERLGRGLPEFMVPAAFVWVDAFPINPSGKLDRQALPAPPRVRPDLGHPAVPPADDREAQLCGLFAEVLGLDSVGAEDGFFVLGGSSLLAMGLLAKLRERLGLDVPVARFFQHATPRELGGYLARASGAPAARGRFPAARPAAPGAGAGGAIHDSVAIIGMAGRFPGARDVATLWANVCAGISSVTRFDTTLDPSVPAELANDPAYVKARGVIEDYDKFDAGFFAITPKDAELMDPQQRLFLEASWEALENAGYVPETVGGTVGVFAGMYGNSYLMRNVLSHPELEASLGAFALLVQNEKDYVATRVAHKLDLTGPAVNVQSACSTSLVAVVEAFWSLRTGQCDVAIAGAASVTCPVESGYVYVEGGMLSPDGHTRSFDAKASGTAFNDGVAAVVLKRLADAERDGDTIYGVIRGAAMNNDGARKASFTAPSVEGQVAVIRMAQAVAGVDARSIGYVEAHGTATPIGDPIEIEALTEAFRMGTADRQFCAVSSIKSNIGHLVAASGATGLIKAALTLTHERIPPTAHYAHANPKIDFASSPFYVADRLIPWPRSATPRRAGVSSFGVGGTNAHVVVEEAPPRPAPAPSRRPCQLLVLSARTPAALERATARLGADLAARAAGDVSLADVAYTLARGRRAFPARRFAVVKENGDLAAQAGARKLTSKVHDGRARSVALLFPGQGSQYPNMGRGLYAVDPVFRAVVDECAAILQPEIGQDLRELVFPESGDLEAAAEVLRNTAITQPALFVMEYATAQVLLGWGVQPAAMIGHSVGEFVCAVIAGVMSLEDALRLVAARGRLLQDLPRGSMLSVRLPAADLRARLPPEITIGSDNGPTLCVASGPVEAIEALRVALEADGIVARLLVTSHAFHSPMMEPAVAPFLERVKKVRLAPPRVPFVSTLTGALIRDEEACDPMYWARHLRETVRFAEAARVLLADPKYVFVEAGPRGTLSTLVRQQAPDAARLVAVPTLGDVGDETAEWTSMLSAVGHLFMAGVPVDWESFYAGEPRRRTPLPTYPFERERHWIGPGRLAPSPLPADSDEAHGPPSRALEAVAPMPAAAASSGPALWGEVCAIVTHVSGVTLPEPDAQVTFLELGLDSLTLTQVGQKLAKLLATRFTLRDLIETYPTVAALAAHVASLTSAQAGAGGAEAKAAAAAPPDPNAPPVPGARLGRDPDGTPAWYVPNPDRPGKYVRLRTA